MVISSTVFAANPPPVQLPPPQPQRVVMDSEYVAILSATGTPGQMAIVNSDATTIDNCSLFEATPGRGNTVTCTIQYDVKNGT